MQFSNRKLLRRLKEYRQKHPDKNSEALKNLDSFISSTDHWDFLSQTLDGFTQQLALRDIKSNVTPAQNSLDIGDNNSIVPELGNLPQSSWQTSHFQPYRSGHFLFHRIDVVDRFGQSLIVVNSNYGTQFTPIVSADMKPKPGKTAIDQESYRFVELKPRLLQPGRLNFDYVSCKNDSKIIDLHTNVNPICARGISEIICILIKGGNSQVRSWAWSDWAA